MKITRIKVSYIENNIETQPETYYVVDESSDLEKGKINRDAALVKAIEKCNCQDEVSLSKDVKYKIIEVDYEENLSDLTDKILSVQSQEDVIEASWRVAEILKSSIIINDKINSIIPIVVSAHLNLRDVKDSIAWIKVMENSGYNVSDIRNKLEQIEKVGNDRHITNITDVFTLNQIAKLHKELGAYNKAKRILLRAYQLKENDPYTLTSLGSICKETKDYEEGIDYCKRSLSIKKNDYVTLNALGALYRRTSEYKLAERCYKKSLNINSQNNSKAHTGIATVFIDMELFAKAKQHFILSGKGIDSYIKYLSKRHGEYKDAGLIQQAERCWRQILKEKDNRI